MSTSQRKPFEIMSKDAILECHTRFLMPFEFAAGNLAEITKAFESSKLGSQGVVWERAALPSSYREEMLAPLLRMIDSDVSKNGSGAYLRFTDSALNWLYHDSVAILSKSCSLPLKPVWSAGIELFLFDGGIGILSVALQVDDDSLDVANTLDFNYRLAQSGRKATAQIRMKHPSDSPESWAMVPEADRAKIGQAPPLDAPLNDRLGVRGGSFDLTELCRALVAPVEAYSFQLVQPQLSIYTVVRCSAAIDLADHETRNLVGPFLAGLAQVEESNHSGAPCDDLGVPTVILNRRHWSAAGLFGAAHVVADQPSLEGGEPHPYNQQRVPRVRDKYFLPYLSALAQRLVLQRAVDEASKISLHRDSANDGRFSDVRGRLMEFAVDGRFSHVTNRYATHRFYRLAREGLAVTDSWVEVERAIAELDARDSARQQAELNRDVHQNLALVAHTQKMIEWIEIFLVSVYGAHLWFMVGEAFHLHGWPLAGGTIFFAVAGALITSLILKPWRHRVLGQKGH